MTHRPKLTSLHQGFRDRYLDYEGLLQQLEGWTWAYPDLVKLTELARTPEGRRVWVLTLGPEPDRTRPAFWVDAAMHASEFSGTNVCLAFAEAVLALHLGEPGPFDALPAAARDTIRETLVYVCPLMSPDGVEAVLKSGRWVRSVPRDDRPDDRRPRWEAGDVDGDGRALLMRVEDPTGEFVAGGAPGLLHLRKLEDEGPFYKVWPEGTIRNFDGRHVPSPGLFDDNYPDLNRNFPFDWRSEREQIGAGDYPGSEPESRALMEFARARPNLFAWLNLHTFGGVGIRPLGDAPDNKLPRGDLALFNQLGEWLEGFTGYPMVSGYEEFTYAPETPLRGDMSEWAYRQRGCISFVVELWDIHHRVGQPRPKRFVDRYARMTRDLQRAFAAWDREHNQGRMFVGWTATEHPQLGPVEVGGMDPREGMWNPPREALPEVIDGMVAVMGRLCALAPRLSVEVEQEALADGVHRLTVTAENRGYLPTYIVEMAKRLAIDTAPFATVEGVEVVGAPRRELGHLDGWGRGRFDGSDGFSVLRSRGTTGRRSVTFLVRGEGPARVRVGCPRTGWVEVDVDLS